MTAKTVRKSRKIKRFLQIELKKASQQINAPPAQVHFIAPLTAKQIKC